MKRKGGRSASKRGLRGRGRSPESPAQPQEAAPATGTPPPPKRRRRLKTLANIRRGLADLVHSLEAGADVRRGRVLVYAFATLASVVKDDRQLGELVARLERLEQTVGGRLNGSSGPWRPAPPERGAEA